MFAKDLISTEIPALKTSYTGEKAIAWMEFYKVSHLPIVNNEDFLGLISESDIYNLNSSNEAIGNHNLSLIRPFVNENKHVWELIDLANRMNLSVVPILSEENEKYLGAVTLMDMIKHCAMITCSETKGSIIVLEMGIRDYSLNEISRIAEDNDVKILSLYVSSSDDSMRIKVNIKFDTSDITSLVQTFNRFDYKITASFTTEDYITKLYRDRYESFINYLNV